jgi:hypothetical protein
MNTIEFVKDVPAEQLAAIFKDFFEQHMFAYYLLRGVQFVSLNSVDIDTASIMYSVKLLDGDDKDKLLKLLTSQAGSLNIYGRHYTPNIFLNGDLLCITIKK